MIRTFSLAAVCLLMLQGTAIAQDRHEHKGFWIGFGFGGGVNLSQGLDNENLVGGGGYFRLGGTPSQRVLVGGEGVGWGAAQSDEVVSRGNGMFIIMFFPSENGGFFLKGGVGGASVSRVVTEGFSTRVEAQGGLGTTAGLGFDIRLGRNIYLTPNADWVFQVFDGGNIAFLDNVPNTNSLLLFTLGLTWH